MLYSKLIGKTKKEAPKDEPSLNAQLLIRGGFVNKELAGVYSILPLGLRVQNKIINIIREELNNIGCQEIQMTSLQNPQIWQKSQRWEDDVMDVWFKTKLHSGTELGLAATHEEPITEMMKSQISSYKDLPKYVYQFQTKFRNELRSKSGLLRTREFIMNDLYSFNKDEEDLENFYEEVKKAYIKIFKRLGIGEKTYLTFASGGVFSKFSHEFQTICEKGEDIIYLDEEKEIAVNKEVYTDEIIRELELDKENLKEVKAIEIGNIFKLKTRFSDPLELTYTNEEGNQKLVFMGSYGIGIGRALATIVELNSDGKGIIWPKEVAPFQVNLIGLNLENKDTYDKAFKIYEYLKSKNIEVLFDDRIDTTPGQKFIESDLIGIPIRAVVSNKTGEKVEVKNRKTQEVEIIEVEELIKKL